MPLNVINSQTTAEVTYAGNAALNIRASQTTAEVSYNGFTPGSPVVRVSQVVKEVSYCGFTPGVQTVRISQVVLEVLCSLTNIVGWVSIPQINYPGAS